jgi:RNA polymerase sigma-70 factor (ECF subfamily)
VSWPRRVLPVSDENMATSDRLQSDVVAVLVARAKRGDGEAFGALYDHYVGQVYAFVAVRLTNQEEAEDMTQTIFVRALRSLATCREDAAFAGWLFAIARNSITDAYRAGRTRPETLDDTYEVEDPTLTPEETLLQQNDARVLNEARAHCLSPTERELFDLLLTDMNDKQIAHALGRTHGAIRTAHHRLMTKLRECLETLGMIDRVRGARI